MIYKRLQTIASNQLLRLIKQFSKIKNLKLLKRNQINPIIGEKEISKMELLIGE